MKPRTEYRIVFDMLKVLEHREIPTPFNILWDRAKLTYPRGEKFIDILEHCHLALVSEDRSVFCITQRGLQYLATFREILSLMGEKEE